MNKFTRNANPIKAEIVTSEDLQKFTLYGFFKHYFMLFLEYVDF